MTEPRVATFTHSLRRSLSLFTVVAVPLILGALAGHARAAAPDDEAESEARRRFRRGTKLFDDGKFREAAHEFESGYAVLPRTGFLMNIAHSYRRAGDLKKAKRYYELFLQRETDSPLQRAEAAEYIKIVDEALAEQSSDEPPAIAPAQSSPKDKLAARRPPDDPTAPMVISNAELEKLCRAQPEKTPVVPWVVAGLAALVAAGLAAALIITNMNNGTGH
jgi:tetratricopeptide (TPR) repeat protein